MCNSDAEEDEVQTFPLSVFNEALHSVPGVIQVLTSGCHVSRPRRLKSQAQVGEFKTLWVGGIVTGGWETRQGRWWVVGGREGVQGGERGDERGGGGHA